MSTYVSRVVSEIDAFDAALLAGSGGIVIVPRGYRTT
jgi:hypothetical protein